MNNSVFGKIMEIFKNHKDINFVTFDKTRDNLLQGLNYHTANGEPAAVEMNKISVKTYKPVCPVLSILDISKITATLWLRQTKI